MLGNSKINFDTFVCIVNISRKEDRVTLLKATSQLEHMDDESEDSSRGMLQDQTL